ncbi:MAG: biosynthetic-type acetolactate synthase large subunit [Bacteroidetes bacterium]|nr:biosynthetic-type acetolactate synthase large subunit [Bacteroidota bacterium]
MKTTTLDQKKIKRKEHKRVTGSEAILQALVTENIKTVFGYPGGAIMPLYDKLMDFDDKLHHILTRHEQGAVHAAQGFARVSGEVGVCFATSGPGAANLLTGIADAFMDSTPLVCFTGQVFSHLLGSDAFQETDVVGVSMPVTKWNFQITRANEIAEAVAKAFYIARSGRPGPVLLDITKDAMVGEVDFYYKKCDKIRSYIPVPVTKDLYIQQAVKLIDNAKKPFVLFGQGVTLGLAELELIAFLEKTGIPAASTLLGLSALPNDHELYTGMLGMHGNAAPNIKTNEADLIIGIGMRFDDRVTGKVTEYAPNAKKIHFEIDKAEVNKIIKVDVKVLGNVKHTLAEVTTKVSQNSHKEWRNSFKKIDQSEQKRVIKKNLFPETGKITMGEVIQKLNIVSEGEAVIVTDVGQHQMIASRYYNFKNKRSNITSGGLGTMGFGLPAAMGAQIAAPDRKIISISGDGGFQMTLQELGTIAHNKIPVKMIILNNSYLGMVRQWQELFFDKRYASTAMTSPDFVKLADSYGIKGEYISDRDNLQEAVQRMWDSDQPYLLEIKVKAKGNVFPMIPAGCAVDQVVFGDEK